MKVVKGFRLRKLVGEYIVVPESTELINFNKMLVLNESAAYLWEKVQHLDEFSVDTLADLLVENYEIDRNTALKDSEVIADKWLEEGIVTR